MWLNLHPLLATWDTLAPLLQTMGHNKQQKSSSTKKSKAIASTNKASKEWTSNRKKKLTPKAQGWKNHLNDNSSDDKNGSDDDKMDEAKEDIE